MARRFLGSGVTSQEGETAVVYRGSGRGRMNLISKNGETFIENTLLDASFQDNDLNASRWYNTQGSGGMRWNVSSYDYGTLIGNNSSSSVCGMFVKQKDTENTVCFWDAPFCIEMDILRFDENSRLQLYSEETQQEFNLYTTIGHWKIIYDGKTITSINPNNIESITKKSIPNARIGFMIGPDEVIVFKNFVIYPMMPQYIYYFDGISPNSKFSQEWIVPNNTTAEIKPTGTEWTGTESQNKYLTLQKEFGDFNIEIEFKVKLSKNFTGAFCDIVNTDHNRVASGNLSRISNIQNDFNHVRLTCQDNKVTITSLDNNNSLVLADNVKYNQFRFLNYADGNNYDRIITFKDFQVSVIQ